MLKRTLDVPMAPMVKMMANLWRKVRVPTTVDLRCVSRSNRLEC